MSDQQRLSMEKNALDPVAGSVSRFFAISGAFPRFPPDHRRTIPVVGSNSFRFSQRFESANNVKTWAVFFAKPR